MLDAILIVFNRDFAPKDTFVNSILTRMNARGRPYKEWMTAHTPLKVIVHPDAQNPTSFLAQGMVQFRLMGVAFSFDNVEQATLRGVTASAGPWLAIGASETEMVIVKQASWNTAPKHSRPRSKSIKRR